MREGSFVVRMGNLGPERVVINGQDVTDLIEWVNVFSQHGQAKAVRLGLKAGVGPDEITGDGVIEVEPAGEDVARWLGRVDPAELERVVTDRMISMPMSSRGSPFAAALTALRQMASGTG